MAAGGQGQRYGLNLPTARPARNGPGRLPGAGEATNPIGLADVAAEPPAAGQAA
jgi:hypothetical protein